MPTSHTATTNQAAINKHSAVLGPEPDMVSIRDGRLVVDDVAAGELIERFGSPLFVYSETQLRANVRRIAAAMAAGWPDGPVDVLPAFKANPMIATRRILTEEGAGADVYSAGELDGALRAGVEPSRISVNGGGKNRAQIRRCVEAGVRITVEDVDEIDHIQEVAAEVGTTAKVRFRVKPEMRNLWRRSDFVPMSTPLTWSCRSTRQASHPSTSSTWAVACSRCPTSTASVKCGSMPGPSRSSLPRSCWESGILASTEHVVDEGV
jgi:hypothetical protein